MTTETPHSPRADDVVVNYCQVCGRTERRPFKDGGHWAAPFFYRDTWWARGPCPNCAPR